MDSFYWKHLMCATISMGSMGDGGLIMTLYDGTMEAIERIFLNFYSSSQKMAFKSYIDKYFMKCELFGFLFFYSPWRSPA